MIPCHGDVVVQGTVKSDTIKIKDEAKNILGEYESKVSKSKEEIKNLIHKAEKQAEANIIKTNEEFHNVIDNLFRILYEVACDLSKILSLYILGILLVLSKYKPKVFL